MPGFMPIIGRDEAEAKAPFAELNRNLDMKQANVVRLAGTDMSGYDLAPGAGTAGKDYLKSRALLLDTAREGLMLRDCAHRVAARGHLMVGSAAQVADAMEQWFREGAADGFNLMPAFSRAVRRLRRPSPILQARGLVRQEYEGRLRDNLGLGAGEPVCGVSG